MSNFYDEVCEYSYSTPVTENFTNDNANLVNNSSLSQASQIVCGFCEIFDNEVSKNKCINLCKGATPISSSSDLYTIVSNPLEECVNACPSDDFDRFKCLKECEKLKDINKLKI